MPIDFSSIKNYYERPIIEAVLELSAHYPNVKEELWPDVACVALNRVPTRYIRHEVDLAFYLSEREKVENTKTIKEAVEFAFEFVQARKAMKARG